MVPYLGPPRKAIGLNQHRQHHRQENERQGIPEFPWLPSGGTTLFEGIGCKLPGSRMIPAEHALRASLALKLWSI
jgi:hypothetical protein